MAFIKRSHVYGEGSSIQWVDRSRLRENEKVRANYRLATYAVAIPALIATFAWGENDKQISHEKQKEQPLADAQAIYQDGSTVDKFTYSYLSPLRTESEKTHTEGIGLAELERDDFKRSYIMLGRSCLRDSAYDITGDDEKQSAAALGVDGSLVTVYAAGTDAPALKFTLDENNVLNPSSKTAETLEAYNCSYLDEVPVRSAFKADSENWDWGLWQLEEPVK